MSFFDNVSPDWLEAHYLLWKESPDAVTPEWRAFFSGFDLARVVPGGESSDLETALKQSAVQSLIYRYRDIGHLLACTDPLSPCKIDHPLLALTAFDLGEADLDRTFHIRRFMNYYSSGSPGGLRGRGEHTATLRVILAVMRETYCRAVGVEFMHIQEPAERQWLIDRMEPVRNRPSLPPGERLAILAHLREATLFEEFLQRKFPGQTRFSLEGGETLIPLLWELVIRGERLGITDLVLGMPHRGRLSVLATVFGKPLENIFAEFSDNIEHGVVGEGDVKYHKGFSTDLVRAGGAGIHLTMAANPSHLEAIDPVVEGKCRARQDRHDADGEKRALAILVHGDAAFSGQGVVAETFNLSQLDGYRTGGTVHVVLNNQIGFTTLPADARSSRYATDVAKMIMAPVFHVHGENPEAAVYAAGLALEYRQAFARDVVVEVICYRRHGHNEGDEPYFTQPAMYEAIEGRPPVADIYAGILREEGISPEQIEEIEKEVVARLSAAAGREALPVDEGFAGEWSDIRRDYTPGKVETAVHRERLQSLAAALAVIPQGFTPHPKIASLLEKRHAAVSAGEGIDWANAEHLAFASLLEEGTSVRVSGQDVRRGTFSQRHALLVDMQTEAHHVPLDTVAARGGTFRIYDSMLSENAVLGFEYGYSLETPNGLVIWEAQYGDFANGAQVVIDQFVASGETKWDRVSGLVMLLPHGYEGQGAEHSSARIERFLELCADNNLQVAYPSTPAQYFHLLRRQVRQSFRKPLIVFTPKSLLRHPRCVSRLDDLCDAWFQEVLPDRENPEKIRAVLICSGKIYFELRQRREEAQRDDVALVRVEQLYPLRTDLLREALAGYHGAERFAWVQEEPANMGGWGFIRPHLAELLGREPAYVGRAAAPSPAVGSHRLHKMEQERIIAAAFSS